MQEGGLLVKVLIAGERREDLNPVQRQSADWSLLKVTDPTAQWLSKVSPDGGKG